MSIYKTGWAIVLAGIFYSCGSIGHSDPQHTDKMSPNIIFIFTDVVSDPQQTHSLDGSQGVDSLQKLMKATVLQIRRPNPSVPRPYDDEWVPATEVENTASGLRWSACEGSFPWVPKIEELKPVSTGLVAVLDLKILQQENCNAALFEGYLGVPESGTYTFYLKASGRALLRIHRAHMIDVDFGYVSGTELQASVRLKSGLHPVRFYYAEKKKGEEPALSLEWSGPGISRRFDSGRSIFTQHI